MAAKYYYKVTGNSIEKLRQSSSICGDGVFPVEHKDRLTCCKCGYTEFKK